MNELPKEEQQKLIETLVDNEEIRGILVKEVLWSSFQEVKRNVNRLTQVLTGPLPSSDIIFYSFLFF